MKKNKPLPTTEKRNKKSENIDLLTTRQIVDLINSEDKLIAPAVAKESRQIAATVDMIVARFKKGGRLFYVGAGTSGRLGVLDASECPPTFGVSHLLVQGIIAGGKGALVRSVEGAEDQEDQGAASIIKKKVKAVDVVIGIAACGATPFVRGALKQAAQANAGTVLVTCAPESVQKGIAEIIINPVVGPEIVTGSTRMKAGTATKLVLNTITTTVMIKLGKVYGNLMVDLKATNNKLRNRSLRIAMEMTGLSQAKAQTLLAKANGELKTAIVMYFRKVNYEQALDILKQSGQSLRQAIKACK